MFNVGGVSARMAHVSMKIHSFQIAGILSTARHEVASLLYELAGTCPQDMKLLSYSSLSHPCLKIHTQSLNMFEPNIAY